MSAAPLFLVPNTLDLGESPAPLTDVLPLGVIQQASQIRHWVVENAKSTRAFLKRVGEVCPLACTLQEMDIRELPRPPKGAKTAPASDYKALLAPALQGLALGLHSEAGMPAVADPGALLVQAAHEAGVKVVPLVGPSSLLMALAASGMNGQSFAFVGYLPVERAARAARIKELELLSRKQLQTQMVIETPYRNEALFQGLLEALQPGTRLSIACGLSLENAWVRTLTVAAWRKETLSWKDSAPAVFSVLAG